ncbi:MAG: TRAP transporter small permease subunit [Gammaproteobacteria bacterium]|nr:MAG: TRAP transporter small permease subunit [Gammaproteobacteria bacterium]
MRHLIQGLAGLNEWVGRLMSLLLIFMVCLIGYDVAMRYLFQAGSVALQELEWHLFSLIFLLGAAYTFKHDAHVRVDVLYQSHFSKRTRQWINLGGHLLFLLPFCFLIIHSSLPFVYNAWQFHEASPDPGGLPYRFLLKATIPAGFTLLALHALADSLKIILKLKNSG